MFRVINVDVLLVTGYLDVVDAWRVKPGQNVAVSMEFAGPNLPMKREIFRGSVVFVDSEIDHKTQTCKVVAEVKNRDSILRSGMEARLEIYPENH